MTFRSHSWWKKVKVHREPKVSIIVQHFQFNSRTRSLDDYVAALRRLAEHCWLNDMLEEMLRDKAVYGINNPVIKKRILAKLDLTLTKAISVAQAAEITDTGVRELQLSRVSASSGFPKEEKVNINLQLLLPSSLKTTLTSPKSVVFVVLSTILISVTSSQKSVTPVVNKATYPEFVKTRRKYRPLKVKAGLSLLIK